MPGMSDQLRTAVGTERRGHPVPRLLRAEDVYAPRHFLADTAPPPICEWAWHLYPPVFIDREQPDLSRRGELDEDAVTIARIEEGRWIADCPFCPSAQIVSPADQRYLCAGSDGCANADIRGAYARVVFPREAKRDAIEEALLARPDRANRNWRPGETVAVLHAENAQHGVGGGH